MIEATEDSVLLSKIKKHGYWTIIIRPNRFDNEKIQTLNDCLKFVKESKVSLRVWDYPHIDANNRPYANNRPLDYVQQTIDWDLHRELWRMYQSGQFVHLFACHEDLLLNQINLGPGPAKITPLPGTVLSVLSTLYSMTEIYEFASRLAAKNIFNRDLSLEISLNGMKNRKLVFFEPGRTRLGNYVCSSNELTRMKSIPVSDLLAIRSSELALEHTLWVFEHFNWKPSPLDILREEQKKFIERRI